MVSNSQDKLLWHSRAVVAVTRLGHYFAFLVAGNYDRTEFVSFVVRHPKTGWMYLGFLPIESGLELSVRWIVGLLKPRCSRSGGLDGSDYYHGENLPLIGHCFRFHCCFLLCSNRYCFHLPNRRYFSTDRGNSLRRNSVGTVHIRDCYYFDSCWLMLRNKFFFFQERV